MKKLILGSIITLTASLSFSQTVIDHSSDGGISSIVIYDSIKCFVGASAIEILYFKDGASSSHVFQVLTFNWVDDVHISRCRFVGDCVFVKSSDDEIRIAYADESYKTIRP